MGGYQYDPEVQKGIRTDAEKHLSGGNLHVLLGKGMGESVETSSWNK